MSHRGQNRERTYRSAYHWLEGNTCHDARDARPSLASVLADADCTDWRVTYVRSNRDWRCPTPQGGSPLPDRARQLRRRYREARDGRWRFRALAARACKNQVHRHGRRARHARCACRIHRRRPQGRRRERAALRLGHQGKGRAADEGASASGHGAGQGALCWRRGRFRGRRKRAAGAQRGRGVGGGLPRMPSSASWMRSSRMLRSVYDDVANNLCCDWDLGDKAATDAALSKAAHVARIKLVNNRLVGNPMEPRAAIAEFHPETGHYTLWSTTQFPHVVRLLMGLFVLTIPQQKLRVIAPDVGGGFGVKQFHYAEEAVVTWACRKVGRPIKWVCERSEGFISDAHGRDHVTEAELALDADGKFLGLRVKTIANLGGYIS